MSKHDNTTYDESSLTLHSDCNNDDGNNGDEQTGKDGTENPSFPESLIRVGCASVVAFARFHTACTTLNRIACFVPLFDQIIRLHRCKKDGE